LAVLGRLLISSSERLDLPDLLSLDSYAAGDWKYFLKGLVGDSKPFILKGFDVIDPENAIGTQSCAIRVADSVTFYPGSNSGSFFHGLEDGNANAVPLVPELRKNAINYIYLTFSTFNTSVDTRAFWDPDRDGGVGGEFTQDVNTESVLKVDINVSTGSFPANTIPIAKVTVGPVVITDIEDARDLMFRLGTGGINPNSYNSFPWRSLPDASYQRTEPPTKMQAGGVNPFQGADKNIHSLKEWMDVIMTKLQELGGSTYWYEDTSTYNLVSSFIDACATAFKSKGMWIHDTSTPGLLTWTEDISIKVASDPRTYIIRAGSKTLADEQVLYIPMIRKQIFNSSDQAVSWINNQNYVNTIGGAVGLFANLAKGDWIKKANDPANYFLRVEEFYDAVSLGGSTTTASLAKSVRLSAPYLGTTIEEKGRRDQGVYNIGDVLVSDRNQDAITSAGGNFHWMAMRSDTIETISNVITTSLTIDISQHDGSTAKCISGAAHGLVDGDRVTITGSTNFNGTYPVEVEGTTTFYIIKTGSVFANESGKAARYATVTTTARSTVYGLQEESANHGFDSNQTIVIANTVGFNGNYLINKRNSTQFTIPVGSTISTETIGTATLARVVVRSEGGVFEIIQGESAGIGDSISQNMKSYMGMQSLAETYPSYFVPSAYNTLDGMADFNSTVNENLTARISKLTSMMADKAQDKTIKILPSGYQSISNTTNGLFQDITFNASVNPPQQIDIVLPGSDYANGTVGFTGMLSLKINQVAYILVDRNTTFSIADLSGITVCDIISMPIDENTLVLATRLSSTNIWLWDGFYVSSGGGPTPVPGYVNTVIQQNRTMKFVRGGLWAWNQGTSNLTNTSSAFVQMLSLPEARNEVAAQTINLSADGMVAYIDVNRVPGANAVLTVSTALISSLVLAEDRLIIARRIGNNVLVGDGTILLIDGESKALEAGLSEQNKTLIGASVTEATYNPAYSTRGAVNRITSESEGLLEAVSRHDAEFDKYFGQFRMIAKTAGNKKRIRVTGSDRVTFTGETITQETGGLRIYFTGAEIDLSTGIIYGGDATLPLSTNFTTALGTNFTPSVIALNQYHWYSIAANPSTTNADGTMNINFVVLSGSASGATPDLAIKPALGGNKKLGFVVVKGDGSTIYDFDDALFTLPATSAQSKVAQLGMGSGGGSGGSPKIIGGGTFTWTGTVLTFSADAYVEQPRLNYVDNIISQATYGVGFINLTTTNHVAYIERLNASSGGSNLTILVDLITNVRDGQIIIARRDGADVIVGSTSTRLKSGQSSKIYQQSSDQTIAYIGQPDTADSTPTYTHITNALAPYQVIQGNDLTLAIGNTIGNVNDLLTTFDLPSYDEYYTVAAGTPSAYISQTTQNTSLSVTSVTNYIAQSFLVTGNQDLASIVLSLNKTNLPLCDIEVQLWSDSGSQPGVLLTTSSNVINTSALAISPSFSTHPFFFSHSLINGTTYWLVLVPLNITTLNGSDYVNIGINNTSVYVGGNISQSTNSGSTWTPSASFDAYFEVNTLVLGTNEITPKVSGNIITIPVNSRLGGSPQQNYVVGKGALELFLNGQYLILGDSWNEVGTLNTNSSQIELLRDFTLTDIISFRLDATGGPGANAPDDDFNTLPNNPTADNADFILTYDTSASAYKKQTRSAFLSGLGNLLQVNTYSANQLLSISTDDLALVDCSGGSVTINLPQASTAAGKVFYIKKKDSSLNAMIVDPFGSEIIDGSPSFSSTVQYESFTVVCDGISWWLV
jgi:hypothetical protein